MTVANRQSVEQALLRELEPDELKWVDALLERAEALVLLRMPDAVNRAKVDYPFRVVLTAVEAESVSRVLRAPGGGLYKYETEGTYTYSVNQAVASGLLEITPKDWDVLNGGFGGYGGQHAMMDGYAQRMYRTDDSRTAHDNRLLLGYAANAHPDVPVARELGLERWDGWRLSW